MTDLLTSNIAAIITTGAFLIYLYRKDILNKETYDKFDATIQNHLHRSNETVDKNSKIIQETGIILQELSSCIKALNSKGKKKR